MKQPPFTVLHVCVGNICRSPMAERLFVLALRNKVGDQVTDLYRSHGAGTGSWHVGEGMNPPASRQVISRGGDAAAFAARKVRADLIDASDLILCATAEQVAHVVQLRPDAAARAFVLGEFGRLLRDVDLTALPFNDGTADTAYRRGVALVELADTARAGQPSRPEDDLEDPWGMSDRDFARIADEIEETVNPLAEALTG